MLTNQAKKQSFPMRKNAAALHAAPDEVFVLRSPIRTYVNMYYVNNLDMVTKPSP